MTDTCHTLDTAGSPTRPRTQRAEIQRDINRLLPRGGVDGEALAKHTRADTRRSLLSAYRTPAITRSARSVIFRVRIQNPAPNADLRS